MLRRRKRAVIATAAAATAAIGAGVLTATAASAATGCGVDYAVSSQWQGGFGANVTITNLGDPVTGWTLTWSYTAGQTVTQAWNATATQSGANVTATDVSYNGAIATNGTAAFGFNGSWNNAANPDPASFTLNGIACTGAVGASPSPSVGSPRPSSSPGATTSPAPPPAGNAKQLEKLNRGLISVRSGSGNLVSWRLLGTEALSTGFNVYRAGAKLNGTPITNSTNYLDSGAGVGASYTVRAVVGGVEQADSEQALQFTNGYLDLPLQVPAGGTTPDGVAYTYSANDASVGDLDGDGQLDFVVKWDPSNSKDNSQSGYTGDVFVDGYRLNGTRLWRIDLGRNIRAGQHYTQFQVYDYDGDGKAEIAMKTADGTVDGTGRVIGSAGADFRNSAGYVLSGPEFLTMFNGQTGAAMSTVNYDPPRGTVSDWGDSYGNRVDRFLAGTAYLDGQRPSVVMARGYYTRTVIAAWDFRNGSLTKRWTFDSRATAGAGGAGGPYEAEGNHQLSIADVDGDGRDEIVYGSMAVNDNGTPLWANRLFHGDALHVVVDPSRAGFLVFKPHEHTDQPATSLVDARTGAVVFTNPTCTCDNGRGVAGDVYAGNPGVEFWSAAVDGLWNIRGQNVGRKPGSINFLAWWDADPVRELLDGTHIDKYGTAGDTRLLTASGVASDNGTKSVPALSGDLFGDWREEVVWRTSDSHALRIYSTPTPTTMRLWTLLHDPMYRVAIAWENTAYNQPPHPGFFLGNGMATPAQPNIYLR
ncbi:MAG: rhamnogalacturonan endolyase [Micromonosporaceae bacterium]